MSEDVDAPLLARVRALDAALLDEPPLAPTGEPAEAVLAALRSPEPRVRARAAAMLAGMPGAEAVRALRTASSDPDPDVRSAALVALVSLARAQLLPEVVKALRAPDVRVVVGAAAVLGRVGDPVAVPDLLHAFQTVDIQIGAAVAWALGRIGDRAAVPWLLAALRQGFVPAAAAEALGRLGAAEARQALLDGAGASEDETRAVCARALGRLPVESKSLRVLEELLRDRHRRVRLCAALALYELGESANALSHELGAPSGPPP